MHQHPRPPPVTASPANSEQTNPTRTNNSRDPRDVQNLRTASPLTQGSGSSEDFTTAPRVEQASSNAESPAAQLTRLNQVIQNFHTKAALIILHSRVDLAPAYARGSTDVRRVNKWFNLEMNETEEYREDIRRWRACDLKENRPPPMVIEIVLKSDTLSSGQRLVVLDDDGKRWDVQTALENSVNRARREKRVDDGSEEEDDAEVVLERWTIQLGDTTAGLPADLATILPLVYKQSIVLFRSLYTYCNFLPAWKFARKIGKIRGSGGLRLGYRIFDGSKFLDATPAEEDNLTVPLCQTSNETTAEYLFGITESPAGPFSVKVQYRTNCDFRVDDSEALLSSRLAGSGDEDLFRPSLTSEQRRQQSRTEVGSLPIDHRRNLVERPELGQAYGSMSTFHQAGISTGTSPISALRNAQDMGGNSPEDREPVPPRATIATQAPTQISRPVLRPAAASPGRRSSFSFQPFKAPALSASPLASSPLATSPRTTSSARVPALGSLTEESQISEPRILDRQARKSVSLAPDHTVASSASSSPKPAPISRYISSFSHRRARLPSGGTTLRTDEDQGSSGRGSATSSAAQPGSGLIADTGGVGGSSGSMQEDDENISDFLKMLDLQKNLLTPSDAAANEAATRRTTAALSRFHRMRDSNAALSDSMSSSLMLHRSSSSSSRQLSSVPPMVAGTSASTSTSPGKPISPHTPHTPFAPSRLSAAYSHDERLTSHEEETQSPSEDTTSDETAQARSTANASLNVSGNVTAIDIPNSPRPFAPNYRRSSSAQRQQPPVVEDDDIGDLYGMRSASMGADRSSARRASAGPEADEAADARAATDEAHATSGRPDVSAHRPSLTNRTFAPTIPGTDGETTASGANASSSNNPYRSSRLSRGNFSGAGRGVTPPQGSTSSFGGTGGSVERGADSGSAGSGGSWATGRGGRRSGSRPENRFDDEDFLPFAMERSDFVTQGQGQNPGNGGGGGDGGSSKR